MQPLLEAPLVSQMPPIQHERIDVAPHFGQIRHRSHTPVQIRRRRNRHIHPHLRTPRLTQRHRHGLHRRRRRSHREHVPRQHLRPQRRIHDLVHQPQARHCILGVKRWSLVSRPDPRHRELLRQRRPAHHQRRVDPCLAQVLACHDHLLRTLHQQPRQPDHVRLVCVKRLDQLLRRHLDPQVHHVIPVVRQDDLHQVLPDIVDIPLHRRQQHLAPRRHVRFLHVRLQMRHRRLHRLRRLQHLRHN